MHSQNLLKLLAVHMLSVAKHLIPENDNHRYPIEPLEQLFPLFGQNIPKYNNSAINYATDDLHQSTTNLHERRFNNINRKKLSKKQKAVNNRKKSKKGRKRNDLSNRISVRTTLRSLPIYDHDISEGFDGNSDRDEEERDRKIWAEFVSDNDDDEYEDSRDDKLPQYYTSFKEFVDKTSQEPYFLSDSEQTDLNQKFSTARRRPTVVQNIKTIRDIDLTGYYDDRKLNKDDSNINFEEILMPENSIKNNITVEDDDFVGEMYCDGRYNQAIANVDKDCVVFYHCTENTIDTYVCSHGTRFDNRRQMCWPNGEVYCEKQI